MLRTQKAKFAISLIKSRWYKKGADIQNINIIFDSCKISDHNSNISIGSSELLSMSSIRNLRQDDLTEDPEIEHSIAKRQIYGECAALGRKLASLAAEFHLTTVAATLQGLIYQVEQSNTTSLSNESIRNPLEANAKGRPTKRLRACTEEKNSRTKNVNANVRSEDGYICRNCLKDGHNVRSCSAPCKICIGNGHNYLHCPNKENV